MATPVFECLRQNFPNATLTACVRPYARGILEDGPWFDHIIDCEDKSVSGIRKIRRDLQTIKPQAGLLLTNTTHSFLTFKLAGVSKVYGYKRNFRRHFLTDGPQAIRQGKGYKPLPMQEYYLELCRYLGLEVEPNPSVKLFISDKLKTSGDELLNNYGIQSEDKVIGLNPGASFGSSKCWPAEYFAQLAEKLQSAFNCKIILLVGPGEDEIAAKILQLSSAQIVNTAADKINLAALKPLIKRCDLLITNDTGPRHYAVAFNVPHLVLMGPTNPIYTATNLEYSTVLQQDLPCMPCHKKICPLGHHACMREISPDFVMQQASALLQGSVQ